MANKWDSYVTEQYPEETLEHYYRRLAKVADQRLVRLEKLAESGERGYQNVKKWAYDSAMADIKAFDGENARRFNTAPPVEERQMLQKINSMKRFLGKVTSSKSKIRQSYDARAASFNKKYGTNVSWEEIGNAYESKAMEKLKNKYGSDSIARAIANIRNHKEELQKVKEENKKILKVEGDPLVSKLSLEIYDLYGDLFEGNEEE